MEIFSNNVGHHSLTGAPARSVGWRDPGYIHTSHLKELWPNRMYVISSLYWPIYMHFLAYHVV